MSRKIKQRPPNQVPGRRSKASVARWLESENDAAVVHHYSTHILDVAQNIGQLLLQKDAEYGGSWQRRGGVGAYMMLVRKSDRLEEQVKKNGYDIFQACQLGAHNSENLVDTLKDQVGYGLLILAELQARGVKV